MERKQSVIGEKMKEMRDMIKSFKKTNSVKTNNANNIQLLLEKQLHYYSQFETVQRLTVVLGPVLVWKFKEWMKGEFEGEYYSDRMRVSVVTNSKAKLLETIDYLMGIILLNRSSLNKVSVHFKWKKTFFVLEKTGVVYSNLPFNLVNTELFFPVTKKHKLRKVHVQSVCTISPILSEGTSTSISFRGEKILIPETQIDVWSNVLQNTLLECSKGSIYCVNAFSQTYARFIDSPTEYLDQMVEIALMPVIHLGSKEFYYNLNFISKKDFSHIVELFRQKLKEANYMQLLEAKSVAIGFKQADKEYNCRLVKQINLNPQLYFKKAAWMLFAMKKRKINGAVKRNVLRYFGNLF